MNKHLNELVFNLPVMSNKNKKPDKITILKMAVQHMKNLKASTSILSDSFLCQNYITPIELQSLVLKESNEFLIVIRCDSSKILYASESCYSCIGFSPVNTHLIFENSIKLIQNTKRLFNFYKIKLTRVN
jgi:aryl hydrocarbon receptor nuclear translocator